MLVMMDSGSQILDHISFLYDGEHAFLLGKFGDADTEMSQSFTMRSELTLHFSFIIVGQRGIGPIRCVSERHRSGAVFGVAFN